MYTEQHNTDDLHVIDVPEGFTAADAAFILDSSSADPFLFPGDVILVSCTMPTAPCDRVIATDGETMFPAILYDYHRETRTFYPLGSRRQILAPDDSTVKVFGKIVGVIPGSVAGTEIEPETWSA